MRIRSAKGFSIVELLIVIAIIAILAVIAVPNFTKYRYNTNLREIAQGIVADMQRHKKIAVAEHRRYILQYIQTSDDILCRRWWITSPSGWTGLQLLSTRNIVENNNLIRIQTSPNPPWFDNHIGWGYAWVIFETRGTMGQGSITLYHTKTNSTATINTTFLGRVYVTYNMQ